MRIISEKVIEITPEGTVMTFVEGYCHNSERDNLPKNGICEGSNFIEVDTGDWLFFNEETGEYVEELNIQD